MITLSDTFVKVQQLNRIFNTDYDNKTIELNSVFIRGDSKSGKSQIVEHVYKNISTIPNIITFILTKEFYEGNSTEDIFKAVLLSTKDKVGNNEVLNKAYEKCKKESFSRHVIQDFMYILSKLQYSIYFIIDDLEDCLSLRDIYEEEAEKEKTCSFLLDLNFFSEYCSYSFYSLISSKYKQYALSKFVFERTNLFKNFNIIEIEGLTTEEALQLIEKEEELQVKNKEVKRLSDPYRNKILFLSGGHPYLTKTVCNILWNSYDCISKEYAFIAVEFNAYKNSIEVFNNWWTSWTSENKKAFSIIALTLNYSKEEQNSLLKKLCSSVAIYELESSGYVEKNFFGVYVVKSWLFNKWFLKWFLESIESDKNIESIDYWFKNSGVNWDSKELRNQISHIYNRNERMLNYLTFTGELKHE